MGLASLVLKLICCASVRASLIAVIMQNVRLCASLRSQIKVQYQVMGACASNVERRSSSLHIQTESSPTGKAPC